eukprot:378033-Ditylum_brightwellii.AAC.1
MAGGVNPKAQPIDAITGKILRSYYSKEYDLHMFNSSLDEKGQLVPLSRQLCAQWCVGAWDKFQKHRCTKVGICVGKQISDLVKEGTIHN